MERTKTTGAELADAVHSVLAHEERRAIVRILAANDAPTSVSALVRQVVEDREPGSESDVRIRLHHQHLPRMTEASVVAYDPETERVDLTPIGRRTETVRQRSTDLLGGR